MSSEPRQRDCAIVEGLLSEARPLDGEESARVSRHLAECSACHGTFAMEGLMDLQRHGPPGPPLDDVARRRLLAAALEAAGSKAASRPRAALRRSPRSRLMVAAGIAAGLALVSLVGLWLLRRGATEVGGGLADMPLVKPASGQLLFAAGQVSIDAAEPAFGAPLGAGQVVATRSGVAGLRFFSSTVCLLAEGSRAVIWPEGAAGAILELTRGKITVSVSPGAFSEAPVSLLTPQGRIEVLGTVFLVEVAEGSTQVTVLRGVVRATEGQGSLLVRRGESYRLGARATIATSEADRGALAGRVEQLRLLHRAGDATLWVTSEPRGAEVWLDGVLLGVTPLWSQLPLEHVTLRVQRAGYESVSERLPVARGQEIRRDYDLAPSPEAALPRSANEAETVHSDVSAPGRPAAQRPASDPRSPQPGTRAVPVTSQTLMEEAQRLRLARDYAGAVRAYQEILRRFPGQASAEVARVSMGSIQLHHLGRPAEALKSFEAYLKIRRQGPLAEEAAVGRLRALRALGRACDELRAARAFVKEHPSALGRARMIERLAELEAGQGAGCQGR